MSDIFISYARPDQALAQSLADDLKAKGFKVWWDTDLLGSDDFYEVIYTALSNAKAAIVIWTKDSCRSRFVRDEARFALQKEKLIATRGRIAALMTSPSGFRDNTRRTLLRETRSSGRLKGSELNPRPGQLSKTRPWLGRR